MACFQLKIPIFLLLIGDREAAPIAFLWLSREITTYREAHEREHLSWFPPPPPHPHVSILNATLIIFTLWLWKVLSCLLAKSWISSRNNSPERIQVSREKRGFLPLGFCKPYRSLLSRGGRGGDQGVLGLRVHSSQACISNNSLKDPRSAQGCGAFFLPVLLWQCPH